VKSCGKEVLLHEKSCRSALSGAAGGGARRFCRLRWRCAADPSSTANPQDGQSQVIYEDESSGQTGTDQTPSSETPGADDTTHVTSQGGVGQ